MESLLNNALSKIRIYAQNMFDPVLHYYQRRLELSENILAYQNAEIEFQNHFQSYYFGVTQDYSQVVKETESTITETRTKIYHRSLPELIEISQEQLKLIEPFDGSEKDILNIAAIVELLEMNNRVNPDALKAPIQSLFEIQVALKLGKTSNNASYERFSCLFEDDWTYKKLLDINCDSFSDELDLRLAGFLFGILSSHFSQNEKLIAEYLPRFAKLLNSGLCPDINIGSDDIQQIFSSNHGSIKQIAILCGNLMGNLIDKSINPLDVCNRLSDILIASKYDGFISARTLLCFSSSRSSHHVCDGNIFGHICPEEINKLISAISPLSDRISELLINYPENDVLQNIQMQIQKLLQKNVQNETFLSMAFLLENILTKAQIWENHSKNSEKLQIQLSSVQKLLFSWRLNELNAWKHFMKIIKDKHRIEAYSKWSYLTSGLYSSSDPLGLLTFLDSFILCGPIGEFEYRLELLNQATRYPAISLALRTVAKNCARYFGLYKEVIISQLEAKSKPIIEELNGFLASLKWNDKNIVTVLESAQKVHHFVIKIYKALFELHQISTSSILANLELPKIGSGSRPVATRMPSLDMFSGIIFDKMDCLSKNTSKNNIKMKQNALVELFGLLKLMGLKLYQNHLDSDSSMKAILLSLPDLSFIKKDHFYELKCINLWNLFDQALHNPHEDNTVRQVGIFKTTLLQLLNRMCFYLNQISILDSNVAFLADHLLLYQSRLKMLKPVLIHSDKALEIVSISEKVLAKAEEFKLFGQICEQVPNHIEELIKIFISILNEFKVLGDVIIEKDTLEGIMGMIKQYRSVPEFNDLLFALVSVMENLNFNPVSQERDHNLSSYCQSVLAFKDNESIFVNEYGICDHLLDLYANEMEQLLKISNVANLTFPGIIHDSQINSLESTYVLLSRKLSEHLHLSSQLAKFNYILGSVFKNVLANGFCKPTESLESHESNENKEELQEGSGMAEGQGEKDVSNEIEFEEQITGLENDKANGETTEKEDNGDGIDMDQDFDAQLEDLLMPSDEEDVEGEDTQDSPNIKDEFGKNDDVNGNDDHEVDREKEETPDDLVCDADQPNKELDKLEISDQPEFTEAEKNQTNGEQNEYGREDEMPEMDVDQKEDEDEANMDDDVTDQSFETDDQRQEDVDDDKIPDELQDIKMDDEDDKAETDDGLMEVDHADENINDDEEKSKDDQSDISQSNESTTYEGADHTSQDNSHGSEGKADNSLDIESSAQNPSENEHMRKEVGPSLPSESQVCPPVDMDTLEAVLENINKSVHSILEKDKCLEGSHSNDIEFSLQQMYQKTDDQNGVGLISDVKETDGMSDKIDTQNENLPIDLDEEKDKCEKFDEVDGHSSKNKSQRMIPKTNELVHFDSKDMAVPEMNLAYNWDHIYSEVFPLAMELCEHLRLVLEPTKASKLKGDYRTGKRLNLRKLIPYIISQYRKDKIWLRRTKPNKRTYRICLSIDNSKSMKDNSCDLLALKTVSMLTQAFTRLEAGKISLIGFGDDAQVIVPLGDVPSMDSASLIMNNLRFASEMTNMPAMLEKVIDLFTSDSDGDGLTWDLNIVISDGVCKEHSRLQQLLNESMSKRIVNIFVILDTKPVSESILEMNRVEYVPVINSKGEFTGETAIKMKKYLETFPFENYIVVRDVSHLPQVLSDSIRQWFELLTQMN